MSKSRVAFWPEHIPQARPAFAEQMRKCAECGAWFDDPINGMASREKHCPACEYDLRQEARAPRRRGHILAL